MLTASDMSPMCRGSAKDAVLRRADAARRAPTPGSAQAAAAAARSRGGGRGRGVQHLGVLHELPVRPSLSFCLRPSLPFWEPFGAPLSLWCAAPLSPASASPPSLSGAQHLRVLHQLPVRPSPSFWSRPSLSGSLPPQGTRQQARGSRGGSRVTAECVHAIAVAARFSADTMPRQCPLAL